MAKPDPLEKLRRPLQFASRNNFAKIDALTGLERSVSVWLREIEALGPPKAAATRLKELGDAVRGFDGLSAGEKRGRIESALRLLDGIEKALQRRSRRSRESPAPEGPLLTDSIQRVRGVGPKRAENFARLGIRTIGDALFFLPRKYVDRSRLQPLSALRPGQEETFSATVLESGAAFIGRGRRIYEVTLGDSTGVLTAVWFAFRAASMKDRYQPGRTFVFSGVVRSNPRRRGRLEVHHPEVEELEEGGSGRDSIHTGRIVPFYPATEGVRPRAFRVWMKKVVDDFSGQVSDVVPKAIRNRRGLLPLSEALRGVHFPPGEGPAAGDGDMTDGSGAADPEALNAGRSPWHRRLIFDELFGLQTGLALRRDRMKRRRRGRDYDLDRPLTARFLKDLPFNLTSAQERVLGEIGRDLLAPSPMNRLLQGDVGSGKTVVAVWAALSAIQSGHQAVLLAPTEILAEQHAATVRRWTDALGVRSGLLTGRMKERERADLLDSVMKGSVSLVIGTHALIQAEVRFRSLGLAVIDEQQRFGVMQRSALRDKGSDPDILVMTATPIPRSLSLTLYGDLDLSLLDEMPAGRKPVETAVHVGGKAEAAWRLLRRELGAGRQAYHVSPRIEETERSDLKAAVETADRLRCELHPFRVGLLHGRMKAEEKEAVMEGFRRGDIRLLVTTTVIEVGVDVPNATVMWVEDADRYGLSQLHQLRGRVGRGGERAYCVLRARPPLTAEAEARLAVMAETADGFQIADRDLEIRGPGEMFGTKQAGAPDLRFIRLLRHTDLLTQAREDAFALVDRDPDLTAPAHQGLRAWVKERWGDRLDLAAVG